MNTQTLPSINLLTHEIDGELAYKTTYNSLRFGFYDEFEEEVADMGKLVVETSECGCCSTRAELTKVKLEEVIADAEKWLQFLYSLRTNGG